MSSPHNGEEPSDLSSDEFPEPQLMRVSIFFKGGSQVKSSGFNDSGDTSRQGVLAGPGAFQSSVPCTLAATIQRESAGELAIPSPNKSSAKKMPSIVSGKRGDGPSHLPRATLRKKEPPEKKSLAGSVSKVVLGRKSQAYISGAPLAPATFPPISGPPVLGIAKKYSLVPSGPKQPKQNSRKKLAVSRMRESQLVAQEDTNPNNEPAPKGQLPANRPGPSRLSMHVGGYSSGDPKIKTFAVPRHSQLLAMVQEGVKPRVSPPSGDQGPLLHPPPQEEKQPPPGAQDCPQCPVLQREIEDLSNQLVVMQCLIDKFQNL